MCAVHLRLLTAVFLLAGCDDAGHRLIVEVRTDLTAGVDFVTVRAALTEPPTADVIPAVVGQRFITPVRVSEIDGLPTGSYELVVTASDARGVGVVSRTVRIELREDLAVVVTLARSCRDIDCPTPGDAPTSTTCSAGRCVDPACSELTPDRCGPGACTSNGDCTPPVACATGLCVEGGCLFGADDSACAATETCSLTAGCVDVDPPADAGMDAGSSRDAGSDAGPRCVAEVMLADSTPQRTTGGFGGVVSSVYVVLGSDLGAGVIGDDDPLPNGYTGVRSFRSGDEPDFDFVVGALMDGSETPSMAVTLGVGGAFGGVTPSAPLSGTVITEVRRDVTALSFMSDGAGGTDYDATVGWAFFGCLDP